MTNSPTFVLVHSPLVGPLAWQPVARLLAARGHAVRVPSLLDVINGDGPYYGTIAELVGTPLTEPVVLVGHSGAGALLPVIAAAAPETPAVVVFVDALLPHPGRTWFDTAPPELAAHVRALSRSGVLPPWDQWFPADAIAELLPDPLLRKQFSAELPELPLAHFEEPAPAVAPLPEGRCGYLRLSEAYRAEAADAQRAGWRIDHEDADHLAPLTRPERVVAAIDRLCAELR